MDAPRPLTVWAVSDGRAGIENQVLGLAEAVARATPAELSIKRIRYRWGLDRLPTWSMVAPNAALSSSEIAPPWPDLWIAAGRATLPLSIRMKRWTGGRTFVVQAQDPGLPLDLFDLVVPPRHDRLEGANVLSITGAPSRVTPALLDASRAEFADLLKPLSHPRVAVLIGGRSRRHRLPADYAAQLADDITLAVRGIGGSAMTTLSRRTPPEARAVLKQALAPLGPVYDGEGANPYFAFLAGADVALVTADSANMLTEAATAGLPTYLLPLPGRAGKFTRLYDELSALGAVRRFEGLIESWPVEPMRETDRVARAILERLPARG